MSFFYQVDETYEGVLNFSYDTYDVKKEYLCQ
jgi:hypothetical protein